MARARSCRSLWLIRAISAALFTALTLPQAAFAEDEEQDGSAQIIDRTGIASALALETSPFANTAPRGDLLILAVEVNGMDHGLAQFRSIDSRLWASRSVLQQLGLRVEGAGNTQPDQFLELSQAIGENFTYNASRQTLSILVAANRLAVATSRLSNDPQNSPIAQSGTGALLNYDLFANYSNDRLTLDGFTQLRAFSGTALFDNTAMVRLGSGGANDNVVRLDSAFSYSIPDKRITLRAGDIITRATGWSRPTRLGGLRIGSDFALQPYLVTAPIPSFYGEATLPSTVDLYINGIKRYSGSVAPGPFELGSGTNSINGAGQAQLVVTDALGQVNTFEYPLYETPLLLRKGLADWSLEAGLVREQYGLSSFDYASQPAASASYRRGMTDRLTIEAHGEVSKDLWNAGLGLTWQMPMGGVVTGSVVTSKSDGKSGSQFALGLAWTDSNFNLSASSQRTSSEFADIASQYGSPVPRERDLVNVGYTFKTLGTFSASLIRQRHEAEKAQSFVSVNWQKSLSENLSFSVSANQSLITKRERSIFMTLRFSPKPRDHITLGAQANERTTRASLSYRRAVPYEGGTGFALDSSYDGDHIQAVGQIDHLGSHGQATAGARLLGGKASAYAGYSGALVLMGGNVHAARKIFDGFALVQTQGVADVPVLLNNRQIGRTNGEGSLLVTGLNAYQNNLVTLNAENLPANLQVDEVSKQAVPATGAGTLVRFSLEPVSSVLAHVVDEDGADLPLGLVARQEGSMLERHFIGYGAQLYIEEARPSASITVERPEGSCGFRLPHELPSANAGRLGTVICEARP